MAGTEIPGGEGKRETTPNASYTVTTRMISVAGTEIPGGGGKRETTPNASYTVTTRMISALRWAAKRIILMFLFH